MSAAVPRERGRQEPEIWQAPTALRPFAAPPKRVALLIETSREYGRGLLRGINRYQSQCGPWSLYLQPRGLDSPPPSWLRKWSGDGILARIDSREMADAVLASGLPTIDLRNSIADTGLPIAGTDQAAVAELVAKHFLDRGLTEFAYCGKPPDIYGNQDRRGLAFQRFLESSGFSCQVFEPESRKLSWDQDIEQLAEWIRQLPKPVGVLATNDDRGLQVLEACRRAGVLVPDELALVGVDNDEILCAMSTPPMSSVALDVEQIGYTAAAMLDRLMCGMPLPEREFRLPPLSVIARQSSDMTAVKDRDVARAALWIRHHACENISVQQVVRQTSLCRRALEKRFVQVLGRTLNSEIVRVKLERAQRLLVETDLPLSTIAEWAGIGSGSYLSALFHRKLGLTCSEFRSRHRRSATLASMQVR